MRLLSLDTGHLTDEELGVNPTLQKQMQEPSHLDARCLPCIHRENGVCCLTKRVKPS